MRVIGLDQNGEVLVEENGVVNHMGERPEDFVEWYGLADMSDVEKAAIGIVIH